MQAVLLRAALFCDETCMIETAQFDDDHSHARISLNINQSAECQIGLLPQTLFINPKTN